MSTKKCLNGHDVAAEHRFCPKCGYVAQSAETVQSFVKYLADKARRPNRVADRQRHEILLDLIRKADTSAARLNTAHAEGRNAADVLTGRRHKAIIAKLRKIAEGPFTSPIGPQHGAGFMEGFRHAVCETERLIGDSSSSHETSVYQADPADTAPVEEKPATKRHMGDEELQSQADADHDNMTDAEVDADLRRAGVDMRPAFRRLHQMVDDKREHLKPDPAIFEDIHRYWMNESSGTNADSGKMMVEAVRKYLPGAVLSDAEIHAFSAIIVAAFEDDRTQDPEHGREWRKTIDAARSALFRMQIARGRDQMAAVDRVPTPVAAVELSDGASDLVTVKRVAGEAADALRRAKTGNHHVMWAIDALHFCDGVLNRILAARNASSETTVTAGEELKPGDAVALAADGRAHKFGIAPIDQRIQALRAAQRATPLAPDERPTTWPHNQNDGPDGLCEKLNDLEFSIYGRPARLGELTGRGVFDMVHRIDRGGTYCQEPIKPAAPAGHRVELTYFKPSGKYYTDGEYRSTKADLDDIWDEVRGFEAERKLPGLVKGAHGYLILVNVPGHPHEHPKLIVTEQMRLELMPLDAEELKLSIQRLLREAVKQTPEVRARMLADFLDGIRGRLELAKAGTMPATVPAPPSPPPNETTTRGAMPPQATK